ncbi:MAG: DUF5329 family protein [Gemmataceae bacterium]
MSRVIIPMFSVGLLCIAPATAKADEMPEKKKIEALIKHIEGLKDAKFIRNDQEHDAKTAAGFLRSKWERNDAQIKTAREFIDKIASTSSTTGKPYLIRFKDGKEYQSGIYLLDELKKIEKPAKEK